MQTPQLGSLQEGGACRLHTFIIFHQGTWRHWCWETSGTLAACIITKMNETVVSLFSRFQSELVCSLGFKTRQHVGFHSKLKNINKIQINTLKLSSFIFLSMFVHLRGLRVGITSRTKPVFLKVWAGDPWWAEKVLQVTNSNDSLLWPQKINKNTASSFHLNRVLQY